MPARRIALVPAAGGGSRFGGALPKQYADLGGRPLLERTIDALVGALDLDVVFVALAPDDELFAERTRQRRNVEPLFCGGATRADTVANALTALAGRCDDDDWLLVHDAARPCVPAAALHRLVAELADDPVGGLLAIPVADTLKREDREIPARVLRTEDRAGLWQAQTPQMFRYGVLRRGVRAAGCARGHRRSAGGRSARRDGCLYGAVAGRGQHGEHQGDLSRRSRACGGRTRAPGGRAMNVRIGNGFDVHALVAGRQLVLGGVTIPFERGLAGHSDADVLLHAICDAILGALALGDIGTHFPDTDPRWKDADSRVLLRQVASLASARGWQIGNVDATVIAQAPRLAPHVPAMRANIAADLGCELGLVSVKATTTEHLGFAGRGEGIAALATALLLRG